MDTVTSRPVVLGCIGEVLERCYENGYCRCVRCELKWCDVVRP